MVTLLHWKGMRDGPWEICVLQFHLLFRDKKYLSVVVEGRWVEWRGDIGEQYC
jgi:hypothetical protein